MSQQGEKAGLYLLQRKVTPCFLSCERELGPVFFLVTATITETPDRCSRTLQTSDRHSVTRLCCQDMLSCLGREQATAGRMMRSRQCCVTVACLTRKSATCCKPHPHRWAYWTKPGHVGKQRLLPVDVPVHTLSVYTPPGRVATGDFEVLYGLPWVVYRSTVWCQSGSIEGCYNILRVYRRLA